MIIILFVIIILNYFICFQNIPIIIILFIILIHNYFIFLLNIIILFMFSKPFKYFQIPAISHGNEIFQ